MKISVDYDSISGNITLPDGMNFYIGSGLIFAEAKERSEVLELVKHGLRTDDLLKLKKAEII